MPKILPNIQNPSNYEFTWYSRDASGNPEFRSGATYKSALGETTAAELRLLELDVYGSQRLGVLSVDQKLADLPEPGTPIKTMEKGNKHFEFVNLPMAIGIGNVLSVISDRLFSTQSTTLGKVARYTADLVSSSDYFPFGMQMPGRKVDSGKYRYAFNGKEKDDEMKGEGNSYTTEFRQLDVRIGRWLSLDPVVHIYQTPYCSFDNNPVLILDPSGADGSGDKNTGQVTATVYFKWDSQEDHSQDNLQAYIDNFAQNVRDNWNGQILSNGQTVSVENVQFLPAPAGMEPSDLNANENLLTVGNGASASDNSIPNVSYIDQNARNNTGYMYLSRNGSEAGHEFGHMLGLSDRYYEGVTADENHQNPSRRNTTIAVIPGDNGYTYQNNLMAGTGRNLTTKQLNIAFKRWRHEKKHAKVALLHRTPRLDLYDAVHVSGFMNRNIDLYLGGNKIPTKNSGMVRPYTRKGPLDNPVHFKQGGEGTYYELGNYVEDQNLWP